MRDLPASLDLLALGRELLLDELLPLLPPERHRDARLIATAMAIVAREATVGQGSQRAIVEALSEFYRAAAPHPPTLRAGPSLSPQAGRGVSSSPSPRLRGEGRGEGQQLLLRLAQDLRNGAFETSPSRAAAARAILWRMTMAKLREGNPHVLAANGFNPAGEESA